MRYLFLQPQQGFRFAHTTPTDEYYPFRVDTRVHKGTISPAIAEVYDENKKNRHPIFFFVSKSQTEGVY